MHVEAHPSAIKKTKLKEFAVRFFFGGLVTAFAGLIAHKYGPVVGGLFLAFPAIFPASATLVEKHEDEREKRKPGQAMGMKAAGVCAAGAALGSVGMMGFALVIWQLAERWSVLPVIGLATLVWVFIAMTAWIVRQKV